MTDFAELQAIASQPMQDLCVFPLGYMTAIPCYWLPGISYILRRAGFLLFWDLVRNPFRSTPLFMFSSGSPARSLSPIEEFTRLKNGPVGLVSESVSYGSIVGTSIVEGAALVREYPCQESIRTNRLCTAVRFFGSNHDTRFCP